MQSARVSAGNGSVHGHSRRSSAPSGDPDDDTTPSRTASTNPTSFLLPSMNPSSTRPLSAMGQPHPAASSTISVPASRGNRRSRALPSSATWTSSSGDLAMFSDTDEIEDRTRFVLEYNRLAKKHGIRIIVVGDFGSAAKRNSTPETMSSRRSWLSRLLNRTSSGPGDAQAKPVRHRRSFSDFAIHISRNRKEPSKVLSLQTMITLSGKSLLYLPPEFAPRALLLPTCLRATAQYLVQHGVVTRGIFRVPGSHRVVNALFDYYCQFDDQEEVTHTTRCPNLPQHVKAAVHDVASAFKRFLGVLPGGILGSLSLFDAFIAIHSQLRGDPEFSRTRQAKLRARLIALAIGTLKSQFRRELICAVFGMLSLIGRSSELTPHEDDHGRPLPTSDLMGYSALGIVFGPLLVGDLLDSYTMKLAHPAAGLVVFPLTPAKLKKERARMTGTTLEGAPKVNKILIANEITEMLITHWREVVRHMINLDTLNGRSKLDETFSSKQSALRPSASDGFATRGPRGWDFQSLHEDSINRRDSPLMETPSTRTSHIIPGSPATGSDVDQMSLKRIRPRSSRTESIHRDFRVPTRHSLNPLSPTLEETIPGDPQSEASDPNLKAKDFGNRSTTATRLQSETGLDDPFTTARADGHRKPVAFEPRESTQQISPMSLARGEENSKANSRRHVNEPIRGSVPGRNYLRKSVAQRANSASPTKQSLHARMLCQSTDSAASDEEDTTGTRIRKTPQRSSTAKSPESLMDRLTFKKGRKTGPPPLSSGIVAARRKELIQRSEISGDDEDFGRLGDLKNRTNLASKLSGDEGKQDDSPRKDTFPWVTAAEVLKLQQISNQSALHSPTAEEAASSEDDRFQSTSPGAAVRSPRSSSIQTTPTQLQPFSVPMTAPRILAASAENVSPLQEPPPEPLQRLSISSPVASHEMRHSSATQSKDSVTVRSATPKERRVSSAVEARQMTPRTERKASLASVASTVAEIAQRTRGTGLKQTPPPARQPSVSPAVAEQHTLRKSASKAGGVRAMAAMWEGNSMGSPFSTSSARPKRRLTGTKPGEIVSPYRANTPRPEPTPATGKQTDRIASRDAGKIPQPKSVERPIESRKTLRGSVSDSFTQRQSSAEAEHHGADNAEFKDVQLKSTPAANLLGPLAEPSPPPDDDMDFGQPRSLGTIVPHQEQPPVDKHLNLSRPPSAASTGFGPTGHHHDGGGLIEGAIPVPTPSPGVGGGNCLLHAQIRSLQKQLNHRNEEVASLRRKLETMENMDIGTLSEQLRDAKRECTMWKGRAEAAEKRIAVFERFTSRLRGIREANVAGEDEAARGDHGDTQAKRSESITSVRTAGTEDRDVVTARIRNSLKALDGTGSMSAGSSASSEGRASAWWNKSHNKRGHGSPGMVGVEDMSLDLHSDMATPNTVMQTWVAVEELLAYDDLVGGM